MYGVHEFISVKRNFGTKELDRFGGVIARAANAHTGIIEVADIATYGKGLNFCIVNMNAFGGLHIQWLEMINAGVDLRDLNVITKGSHDAAMKGLRTGECDLGVSRTETIERLDTTGVLNATDLFVIGDKRVELDFPQFISTPLYSEWSLASLAHVPRELEQMIALPLLTMHQSAEGRAAMLEGQHAGFGFPYSYEPVRQMFIALDHYDTHKCDPGHQREARDFYPKQCVACQAGTFSKDGEGECLPCPLGYVNNGTANTDCAFCPTGLTTLELGSVAGECVVAPENGAAWSSSGNLVNYIVGGIAIAVMVGFVVYARKRSGSLLAAMEHLLKGALPTILGLLSEVSDLGSDLACAIAIIVAGGLPGIPSALTTVYLACVAAHIVPSVLSVYQRLMKIRGLMADTEKNEKAVLDAEATDPTGEEDFQGANPILAPAEDQRTFVEEFAKEHKHMSKAPSAGRQLLRGMVTLVVSVVVEDLVMAVVNSAVLMAGVGNQEFRDHPIFALMTLAAASSIMNFGFKTGSLGRLLIVEIPRNRAERARFEALDTMAKQLDAVGKTDIVKAMQTHNHKLHIGRSMSTVMRSTSRAWLGGASVASHPSVSVDVDGSQAESPVHKPAPESSAAPEA